MFTAKDGAIVRTMIAAVLMIGHSRKVEDAYTIADQFMAQLKADIAAANAEDEADYERRRDAPRP